MEVSSKFDQIVIVVAEDCIFVEKLLKDFNIKPFKIIYYKGRKIERILELLKLLTLINKDTVVITEYANFVPRLISILSCSRIISIIYGLLTENSKINNLKYRCLNLLFTSQYADRYYVVNRKGTFIYLKSIFGNRVKYCVRERVSQFVDSNYYLWISQCWAEIHRPDMEDFQIRCINKLKDKYDLKIVKHPRDKEGKYDKLGLDVINGLSKAIDNFVRIGKPKMVYGLTSSALFELNDYGLNVMRVDDKNKIGNEFSGVVDFEQIKLIKYIDL